jgi:hypothetical protein
VGIDIISLFYFRGASLTTGLEDTSSSKFSDNPAIMPTDSSQIAMRDLGKAKDAFANNDIEASKAAHAAKHIEDHSKVGGFIKSIVFGGLDGQTKP